MRFLFRIVLNTLPIVRNLRKSREIYSVSQQKVERKEKLSERKYIRSHLNNLIATLFEDKIVPDRRNQIFTTTYYVCRCVKG